MIALGRVPCWRPLRWLLHACAGRSLRLSLMWLVALGLSPVLIDGFLSGHGGTHHAVVAILSLGLAWWLLDRLLRARIAELKRVALAVTGGALGARAAVHGADEIAILGQAFNAMVSKLEHDHLVLSDYAARLATRNAEFSTLRHALDAHAIVSITDKAGNIVHANEQFCAISGYSRAELLGKNHRILKSDAHPPAFYAGLWRTISAGRAWHGILQNRCKDGSPYWVQSSILPLLNAAGGHDGYISLRTDITERERLRLALDRLAHDDSGRDPFDVMADALALGLSASVTGVVRFVEHDTRMTELGAWPVRAATPELPLGGLAAALLSSAEPIVHCGELATAWPDDPWLAGHEHGYLFAAPLLEAPGRAAGMVYALCAHAPQDEASMRALLGTIARRAASEIQRQSMARAQARQQAWLEFVIKGAGAGVWDWEIATGAVRFNEQWAAMLGYEPAAIAPHVSTWEQLIHPEDQASVLATVAAHLAGHSEQYESEHRLRKADGDYLWILDRGTVMQRAPDGRPLRMSGVHLDITAFKTSQLALATEQQRLALILAHLPVALWELDVASGQVINSFQSLTHFGLAADHAPATRAAWGRLIHPDDRARANDALEAYLAGALPSFVCDFRVASSDGGWRWILSRGVVAERDERGRPRRVIGMQVDLQEQREAEARLRENEARLQLVINAAELGVWDWRMERNEFSFNAPMAQMIGYAAEDLPTRAAWLARIHADDLPASRSAMCEHLAGRASFFRSEFRLRARSGEWRWVTSRGQVVERDRDGRALRMMGIHLDINDRKLAEAALMTSEVRLRTVLENSPIGIYWVDPDGGLVYINGAMRRALDLEIEDVAGERWMTFLHAQDRARVMATWREFVTNDEPSLMMQYRIRLPSGAERSVLARAVRANVPGVQVGFIGTMEDITARLDNEQERDRLKQQVQQAQKMEAVGQLAGGIAHDFNNILASVIGFGALARERYASDGQGKLAEYLGAIVTAGERGRDLVAKMLAFSRAAPGDAAQAVDANAVARDVTQMLRAIIASSIEFVLDLAAGPAPVSIDAVDLHQVLVNLVVNARDAVGSHGHVRVTVGGLSEPRGLCAACHAVLEGEFIALTVSDDGHGMDAATQARVFDPFFTTKPVGKGTGMGLSVVHGIMHRAGGHLLLESAPSRGTSFTVLLRPAHDAAVALPATTPTARVAGGLAGLRVLVVDDEPLVRGLLRDLLDGEGADATLAGDGQEALELFSDAPERFDVVFTDQTMPGLTGLELAKALRAGRATLPVIVYSGYGDTTSREVARACGVHFLAKPAEPQAIVQAIEAALESARGRAGSATANPSTVSTAQALPA